jgi:ABC-2 type transport system permease protein
MSVVRAEAAKLPAFVRRDFLVLASYPMALAADWLNLLVQVVVFSFVSRLIDPSALPDIGGEPATYLQFVTVGVAVAAFLQVGLSQLVAVIRSEQLMGTLEALLLTPTSLATLQIGSVLYDLVYVPVRTALFLVLVSLSFDLQFDFGQIGVVLVALVVFVPVVWGLGVAVAAAVLTFKRGAGATGLAAGLLTVASGAYFPLELFPGWAQDLLVYNPVTIALDVSRAALIGGAGWGDVGARIALLVPMAFVSLVGGMVAFRAALERELRRGTLSEY